MNRREQLAQNLALVDQRIATACAAAGRGRDAVTLIVVTVALVAVVANWLMTVLGFS